MNNRCPHCNHTLNVYSQTCAGRTFTMAECRNADCPRHMITKEFSVLMALTDTEVERFTAATARSNANTADATALNARYAYLSFGDAK